MTGASSAEESTDIVQTHDSADMHMNYTVEMQYNMNKRQIK